nr:ribonuclease [Agrobacterium sp. AGB01]
MAVAAAVSFREEAPAPQKPVAPSPQIQTGNNTQTSGTAPVGTPTRTLPKSTGFDFYVLSLSWSPSYCASSEGAGNRQQCGTNRRYGFVVHGLWPQNENGYPQFCSSSEPERVPDALGRSMFDIMPSMGLIGHQWRKHGSCSGLSQKDYFAATRAAFDAVKLPPTISQGQNNQTISADGLEKAFIAANPRMSQHGISISCDGGRFEEVRICLTQDLQFRACQQVDSQGCQTKQMTIPPIR